MLLFSFGIEEDLCRGPLGAESFETLRVLLDVDLDGNEILVDEVGYEVIGVNLGFQPSTPRSHRSGAEVEEHGPSALPCLGQPRIRVANPVYFHVTSIVHSAEKGKGRQRL